MPRAGVLVHPRSGKAFRVTSVAAVGSLDTERRCGRVRFETGEDAEKARDLAVTIHNNFVLQLGDVRGYDFSIDLEDVGLEVRWSGVDEY